MHFSSLLLAAGLATAQLTRHVPSPDVIRYGALFDRSVDGSTCSVTDTCSECFGTDYILCDGQGCFNPDLGMKCCKYGNSCIAFDDSCCGAAGPGKPGKDGVPHEDPSTWDAQDDLIDSSWSCLKNQTDEECCQGGGKDFHWCTGHFPAATCYNSTSQVCCTGGYVCEGKGCCKLVHGEATTPWLTAEPTTTADTSAHRSSSSEPSTTSGTDTTPAGAGTASSTPSTTPAATSSTPTPTPNVGGSLTMVKGSLVLVGGIVGGLYLL